MINIKEKWMRYKKRFLRKNMKNKNYNMERINLMQIILKITTKYQKKC